MIDDSLAQQLRAAEQSHLLSHVATLSDAARARFQEQLARVPWTECHAALHAPAPASSAVLRPPIALRWKRQRAEGGLRARLARRGLELLHKGKVAAFLLAGGQGTRLGLDGPKGNVEFGPDAGRTLYRIHAERVARWSERTGHAVPLLVLVNEATEAATRETFSKHGTSFGLQPDQTTILVQGRLPCFDADGRALLAAPGELATAPDGHGGAHTALHRFGAMDRLLDAGVEVISTFQVDNPLARPLDPVMLGWMLERRAHVVTKAVAKASPDERVGVFARDLQGRHRIVEYSELPDEGADDLTLGSIAIHAMSLRWLQATYAGGYVGPLHRATKKSPYWTKATGLVHPTAPNATKLERFIFDILPEAPRLEVHEVCRAWEFAPVKHATGVDSLASAQALVGEEVVRWHNELGREPTFPIALRPRELDGSEAHQVDSQ